MKAIKQTRETKCYCNNKIILSVDEDTYTLLKFDIIDLSKPVDPKIRESIEREGILIYEKN